MARHRQSRARLTCDQELCLLVARTEQGKADCDQELCLLVARTEQGKADLRSGSLWSLARHTTVTSSSHLGMGIQKQPAGGGEVETSLEEVLSGQERVDD